MTNEFGLTRQRRQQLLKAIAGDEFRRVAAVCAAEDHFDVAQARRFYDVALVGSARFKIVKQPMPVELPPIHDEDPRAGLSKLASIKVSSICGSSAKFAAGGANIALTFAGTRAGDQDDPGVFATASFARCWPGSAI